MHVRVLVSSAVIALAFRPDGHELAVATLDGLISFWDINRYAWSPLREGPCLL